MRLAAIFVASTTLAAVALPTAVHAQASIYCCDDAQGRRVCGDFLPTECVKRAYEERDNKGFIIKRHEAPMTPEQIAKREAEQKRKEEDERKKMEERRRNLALLSTYSSEKDVDSARDRAINEINKAVEQAEKQLAESEKNRKKADGEKDFYKNKALPPQVKKQIADAEADFKAKQDALAARKADIDKTRVKFEEEKKKWRELKGIVNPGPATVTPLPAAAPESTEQTPAAAPAPGQGQPAGAAAPAARPPGAPAQAAPTPAPAAAAPAR
jgi:hypothetical protein